MDNDRVLIYSAVFAIMGLSNAVIPVLPEIAATGQIYGVNSSSLLYSSFFLGALLTMLPFGIISDKITNVRLISLGLLLTFISGMFMIFTNNYVIFVLARFIEGTACGAFFPASYAKLASYSKKARYMGEFSFFINAGLAAGVAITGYIVHNNIKNGLNLFTIIVFLTLLIAIWQILPSTNISEKMGSRVQDIRKTNYQNINIFTSKNIRGIWIISFFLAGSSGVLVSLYPEYGIDMLSKTELGIAIALLYISTMISSLAASYLNMEHSKLIKRGIIISALGIIFAINDPIIGFFSIGTGSGLLLVGIPVAIAEMKIEKGLAMGIYNTCIYAGLALLPLISGVFLKSIEIEMIFLLVAIFFGSTIFLYRE